MQGRVRPVRPPLVEKAEGFWRFLHTPEGTRVFRYTMVSVISTAVSFAVLGILFGVARVGSEVPDTIIANLVATVPSYYLNRSWVWGKRGRSHLFKEVIPFWITSFVGIAFSIVTSSIAHHIGVKYFPEHHAARTLLVELANLFAFGSLWILKFLIFNRLFRHPADEQSDELTEWAATAPFVGPEEP
jgi:putative flippase GtrA